MSEPHSPEPWQVDSIGQVFVPESAPGARDGFLVASTHGQAAVEQERQRGQVTDRVRAVSRTCEANARRIVACVNFCTGTDSEYLDGAGNLGRMLASAGAGVNAELLAACEAIVSAQGIEHVVEAKRLARAVLARARGVSPPA